MKLFIAEKPELAKAITTGLNGTKNAKLTHMYLNIRFISTPNKYNWF